jgi:deoxyxylulose-5-phosphate synthase
VLELLEEARLADPAYRDVSVRIVGIPADRFIEHGSVDQLRRLLRLDPAGIAKQIRETLARLGATPEAVAVAPTANRARTGARNS